MNTAVALGIHAFYSSILGFVTAVQNSSFLPLPTQFLLRYLQILLRYLRYLITLPLSLLVHSFQVELDLKRLRDPLQLQLPIQQLTESKN